MNKMLEKHRASLKIDNSIKSSFNLVKTFFDTNDFDKCISMADQKSEEDIFHSALKSELIMLKACMTFDEEDLNKVPKSSFQTIELCNKFRRKKSFGSLLLWKTPDYNKYEEIEIHAELTYAIIMGMSGTLGLAKCHSIVELIKTINRLRLAKNSFKEASLMFKKRTQWESELSRLDFEAGVRLERAIRHLFISYLPPKLLRLLNFLGLKGIRSIGFNQLNKTALELNGVYSLLAEFSALLYWMFVETHGSLGPKNLNLCEKIINKGLELHPNNYSYRFLKNKLTQLNGNIELSIDSNIQLLNSSDSPVFDRLCHWELMWSYALKCEWDECIKYSELIRKQAFHSPAIFTYLEAIFRYRKGKEENDVQLIEEATKLFQVVPTLRIRYLGKTITYEKAAVDASKFFFQNKNFLLFPVINMLYSGNMFYIIDGNYELLLRFMSRVEKEIEIYAQTLDNSHYADNYLDAIFHKGVLLKHMRKFSEAQQCFKIVIKEKEKLEYRFHIPPQSVMELGLIEFTLNNYEESKLLLNKALNEFSGYISEHLVHIRCYSALREMGVNTDKDNECEVNIMEEYAKKWAKTDDNINDSIQDEVIAY